MGRKRASTSSKEEPLEERRNMNLPFELIPRYDPDEGLSYDNWSRLFDHQAQQQGLSSKESLSMMPMLFKGKALEMYALICRDISSLEELHSRMKRFFHEPEHGLHRKFWQVRKGREQSVKEYYFAKIKLATKLGLSQELILEGLTSGIESEFERFLIAASPTSLERWLEIAEAIEISHCRTTSSASGMEMGYPARRRPSTSWQGGQGFRTRNWREGRNDRPGTHLPPTRSQTASLAAVQDHEDSGAVPYVLKSKPVYQPDAKPLPLPDTNDCFLHDNIELFTMVKILLDNHAEIFGENKFNIKPLNIQPPRLRLSDKKPVCVRPYRHSLRDRDLINQQIEQLLKYGLIKPASSPYSAPVTLAPKKGEGRVRLCIDYRLLNRKIISDSFPIPLMEDIVQKVQGARVFSCLDILSAYWTIPLHPKDREMTCFSTSEGSYVWCRLPFGLKTAPAIFNRKLSAILQKYKLDNVTSYFDDILVFSENEESHLKHLGQIFEILRKEGIQLRRDKCLLFMKRITYLGYEISENQISPSGVNVDVIKSLPPPRDLRCLRSFLGSVTHYAKFINNFNNLRAPLNELLKKNSRFIWTEECQRSFEGLKEALCSKPILQLFNPSLATHIYCDASTSGIGAVLKQEYPDGTQKPFTYFSRALRGAESKYTITELELLAVVETCKRYHPYISGSHVIVHTDHKALIWLNSFKHTNGRLFRWSLKLSEYDLDFNYNKGCENHEADMLSRLPYSYFLSAQALKQNQGDLSIPPSKLYSIVDGITYIRLNNKDRVVVPPELQDDLIQKAHESLGHPGISAMIRALSVQYYFKGMIGKIKNYVKNCKECQTIKSSTQPSYGLMGSLPRAAKPFDVVALDTVLGLGGYNSAKNCVHTVIDHHSRYIWGYASKGTSIATYINIINQLLNIGKPRILVTDRHPSFVSKRFNKFLQEKGIKHVMTSPSHPECNGLVERANATLIGRLKIQHQGNPRAPWPKLLQKTLEEYRDTPHSTTTFPPIYLLYGTLPSYMSDLTNPYPPVERARTSANEKTEELHKRLVKRYNSSHRFPNLKIGDKVLYRIPHQVGHGKLSPVYYPDPYTVLSTPSPHTVEINKPCQPENKPSTIVNVSKLKLWDPISTSNEGRRNYPFPFQDVEDLNGSLNNKRIDENNDVQDLNSIILLICDSKFEMRKHRIYGMYPYKDPNALLQRVDRISPIITESRQDYHNEGDHNEEVYVVQAMIIMVGRRRLLLLDQKVAKTLESVQRTAALIITGGYRTTSSEAFLVLAGLIPPGLKLEEETIRQKIWENREDALGLEAGALEWKRDPRKPSQWLPKWNWSPGGPTGIGTVVFTDGSKSGTNTGAEVVIFTNGELIFKESLTLRVDELVFSAELVAIRVALRVCAEKNFSPDRLYSDCMSALVAINLVKGQLAHQIIQELEMTTRAPELYWVGDTASSKPAMAAALQKIDIDPEQQLYTPKIVDIAAAVMEMHGDI
ncbi:hypothetical protein LAZ67_9000851 [Cordylochernes scorpioides]|uniref:RNA-directed DNA polymerase n=1 Tax=Cordylochernes scorpioides TaxID=51811 RepID=A0ABY6KW18_9ARAC|nr:hypothetical protein LAZ67_9000851 [Cordylochernes scorpioides]